MSENLGHLAGRKGEEHSLFERVVQAAKRDGTPGADAMRELAGEYLFGEASVYGMASFYDFTRPGNRDVKVRVCNGSACLVSGTQAGLAKILEREFSPQEIGSACCLGRCHENAAFQFGGRNHSGKSPAEIENILRGKPGAPDEIAVSTTLEEPILTAKAAPIAELYPLLETVIARGREAALAEIKASGLRGRGGAGFPIGIKLEACLRAQSDRKFIVCNADEGDPGAYSDRYLLEQRPHLALFGMLAAGFVAGADRGVLYIRGEYPEAIAVARAAIGDLERAGWLGQDIRGTGFAFRIKVIEGAGAYICGEETALLSSIEGQRPEVRARPPYPVQAGLFGKPTVVNNVETLANLRFILERGGAAFARIGTPKSSGTKLVCLDGLFVHPGLCEVAMGAPFADVVYGLGGGFRKPVKAVHVGGPLGGLVPVHKIPDLTVDFESFSGNGFLLGHAGTVCVPAEFPMIAYLEHLFEFTAAESCGKCFPCSLGTTRGKEMLAKARSGGYKIPRPLFEDLLETLEIGSLCALGGGLPLAIKNALRYFEPELKGYFR